MTSVMNMRNRSRFAATLAGALAIATALTIAGSAASPRFYDDDPVWLEPRHPGRVGA